MPWLLKIFPSMENPISPSLLSPALQIEQTDNRERDQRGEEPSPFHRSFWILEFTVDVGLLCWPRFVLGHFLDFAVSSSSTSRQNASDRLVVAIAQASASAFSCRGIQPKRGRGGIHSQTNLFMHISGRRAAWFVSKPESALRAPLPKPAALNRTPRKAV
jgi:hypothetical protein